jgi:hypothetical protein
LTFYETAINPDLSDRRLKGVSWLVLFMLCDWHDLYDVIPHFRNALFMKAVRMSRSSRKDAFQALTQMFGDLMDGFREQTKDRQIIICRRKSSQCAQSVDSYHVTSQGYS